jgi:hypothetical protein
MNETKKITSNLLSFYSPFPTEKSIYLDQFIKRVHLNRYKIATYPFPEITGKSTELAIRTIIEIQCKTIEQDLVPTNDFVITTGYIGSVIPELLYSGFSEDYVQKFIPLLYQKFNPENISFFIDEWENEYNFLSKEKKKKVDAYRLAADICGWRIISPKVNTPIELADKLWHYVLESCLGRRAIMNN